MMWMNRDRAEQVMNEEDVDGLVAGTIENVMYLTGFEMAWAPFWFGGKAFAILPRNGSPTLIVPDWGVAHVAERETWTDDDRTHETDVRTFGIFEIFVDESASLSDMEQRWIDLMDGAKKSREPTPPAALVRALRDVGLENARLGVDEPRTLAYLQETLPGARVRDAHEILRRIRAIKTPFEVERLRRGSNINEAAIAEAFPVAEAGTNFAEVGKVWRQAVTREGAFPSFWMWGGGRRGAGVFARSDFDLSAGDMIRVECGCTFGHYWADTGRTAVIGEPSEKLTRYYQALEKAREDVEPLIRPGTRAREIPQRLVESIRKVGIPHFEGTAWGHGLGLEAYDLPRVTVDSDDVLEEGMVFALETPHFEIGWGGIQLEETYQVTAEGAERLTTMDRSLIKLG